MTRPDYDAQATELLACLGFNEATVALMDEVSAALLRAYAAGLRDAVNIVNGYRVDPEAEYAIVLRAEEIERGSVQQTPRGKA